MTPQSRQSVTQVTRRRVTQVDHFGRPSDSAFGCVFLLVWGRRLHTVDGRNPALADR